MTAKELIAVLENIPGNTEIRYFHDGMLLPLSTMKELKEDTGWVDTVALSDVVSDKYANRFK